MKKLFTLVFIGMALTLSSQIGKIFPALQGTLLNDKAISLPINNGKFTVIGIVYNRDAEDALKKWLQPMYDAFISKDKGPMDMGESHDVNFVFIPMIKGLKWVREEFKSGTDKEYWGYIMDTEKSDVKIAQKELDAKDNKIPYFYVLDKNGKIIASQSGSYTEAKMDALEEAAE
jgi:hypothetical protein